VWERLRQVRDPELRHNIVDLQMVREVRLGPERVDVDIALTVAGCPLHQQIEAEVRSALAGLAGIKHVGVRLDVMDAEERKRAFQAAFRLSQGGTPANASRPAPAPNGAVRPRGGREIPVLTAVPKGPALLDPGTRTTIIGVASGKGGVGKSTVTANLAVALAQEGHRVGLMDIDVYGFSQGRMLGIRGEPHVNADQKIIPWEAYGVQVVSMGMFVPEDQAIIWRGPMLGKMMQQFFADVAWDALDYLLMDLPPGTGDVALDVAQRVHHASLVLVTTPQPVATHVATRAAGVAQKAGQTIRGVIENMSYLRCPHGDRLDVFGEGGGRQLADLLGVPLLGQVPLEPVVRRGGDEGLPVVVSHPDSEAAAVFRAIAQKLAAA
jgi:ATP-binding protein involved in chromosome partitioning